MDQDIDSYMRQGKMFMDDAIEHLNKELINIGRKLDNHIVIHDPQVSRNHETGAPCRRAVSAGRSGWLISRGPSASRV